MLRRFLFQTWYFHRPPWDTGISPPELLAFIQDHPAGRAIDLGCGTGTNVITLARAGWQVTGIDFAPRAIRLARKKLKAEHIRADVSVNDATRLHGIHGPFVLALDIGCFHGLPQTDREKYLAQLDRVLAPGGFWLLYGFLRPEAPGLGEADLRRLASRYTLHSRQDGFERGDSPSAWFLFQNKT